jgi:WD40 repeat protein
VDTLVYIPKGNLLVSSDRDCCIFLWRLIGQHLVKQSTSEETTQYLLKYETMHDDFIRSVIYKPTAVDGVFILMTGAEDKSI